MTHDVVSVTPNDDIRHALRLMLQHKISGLPVVTDNGELVGMLTEGDFLRRAETGTERKRSSWLEFIVGPGRLADEYVATHGRKVREVMTLDPITIGEETSLDEVVHLMEKHRIKRLPVVRGGRMVGIVTRANLVRAVASLSHEPRPAASEITDTAIRKKLLDYLKKKPWAPVGSLNIVVHNGVVELWGSIMEPRERQALIVAAENIPGVKRVRDHLVWVEMASGTAIPSSEDAEEPIIVR
jgi:CBS domain-containing protein